MKKLLVALLLALLAPLAASAQSSGWSTPAEVQTKTRSNWFPSVAADPWGNPHLVWSSGDGDGEKARDLLMYSQKEGDGWTEASDIIFTGIGGWAARNSLAIDRTGRLHLLVRSRDHIYYTTAAPDNATSAHGWKELRIMNGVGMPYYSAIAVDATGVIHVVYQEISPRTPEGGCVGCSDVWYRRSTDGGETWSAPVNISKGEQGSIKLQIAVDTLNNLYVTWDEGKDPNAPTGEPVGVAYAISNDRGESWKAAQSLRLPDAAAEQGTLAVSGTGELVHVFRSTPGDRILFRTSNDSGDSWSEPQEFAGLFARDRNDTPWDKYAMATDSAGNIHLLAVVRRAPDAAAAELVHLTWSGVNHNWSEAETLVADAKLRPEWPQLIVADGNRLHATWFTRNADDLYLSDTTAAYKVWYSTQTVDAPAVAVEIVPTPTPVVVPTPTPAADVKQADVVLAAEALRAAPPLPVKSEGPLMRNLGLSLAAPVLLFGILLALVLRKRMP